MTIDIQKSAIDIGIITKNPEAMLKFYHEILGLELETVIDMPGGGVMNRLKVGDSVIKIIDTQPQPSAEAAPGGIRGATGYRYWTITVGNLAQCIAKLDEHDYKIIVASKVVRPGVTIAIVADPDGNWLELLENS
ncbi:MAG: extradiol dioxygenase [SAR86 cluster bacterium]|uniref:Extradiol dioxygenase n=1 Tax=SAR86 cluster bacterium TaxID=2030880 RepID=A0A2A4MPC9_9GAMM|nr:MAG: extradiol dioxygenase [SAR86 cluster bacterium]